MKLVIQIPCYNEADNLDALLARCVATLNTLGMVWEIVLVDDGSRDNTALQLAHWSAREPRVRALLLSRNFGKEAALSAGLDAARGQTVVLMDADLQHEPELVPTMLQRWKHGIDVVYARRRDRSDEPWFKRTFTQLFYRMLNATHPRVTIPADAGDFRLLDRHVVDVDVLAAGAVDQRHREVLLLGERQRRVLRARAGRELGPLTGARVRFLARGQRTDGRRLEQGAHRQPGIQCGVDGGHQPHRRQRVTTQIEE